MAIDLISLVSRYLTPQLVSQIASVAGVDPDSANKLISGAIPAVLASLGGAIAAPGGAQKVSDAISNADPDLLTKLASALGSGQLKTLNDGAAALSGLIGARGLSSLATALGQHADIPPEAAQPAVGAVSQAVIGVIGQQDPSNWSDPAAITNFIASQKNSIMAALPPGLSTLLNSSGLLAGLSGIGAAAAAKATTAASSAASSASAAASRAATSASSGIQQAQSAGSGFPSWLIWVIVIVIIAAIAWYFFNKKEEKPAATFGPATIEFALSSPAAAVG
jgi:OOP family OmpA-OmpF porin